MSLKEEDKKTGIELWVHVKNVRWRLTLWYGL